MDIYLGYYQTMFRSKEYICGLVQAWSMLFVNQINICINQVELRKDTGLVDNHIHVPAYKLAKVHVLFVYIFPYQCKYKYDFDVQFLKCTFNKTPVITYNIRGVSKK